MKVIIVHPTGGGISGGYRMYIREVIPRLCSHPDIEALLCIAPTGIHLPNILTPHPRLTIIESATWPRMAFGKMCALSSAIETFRPDVLFVAIERFVNTRGIPCVTMVQNLAPFSRKQTLIPWSERVRYCIIRYATKLALETSDAVITPTQAAADQLRAALPHISTPMHSVHYGMPVVGPVASFVRPSSIPESWRDQFLFTAGSIEPNRGLEDLIRAYHDLKNDKVRIRGVVIAGSAQNNMRRYRAHIRRLGDRLGCGKELIWTGFLTADEMAWCFHSCRAYVMTSRIESFGLAGLGALAHGCMCVVTSNATSRELYGTAVRYYMAGDSQELSKQLRQMINLAPAMEIAHRAMARERASIFSWDRTVDDTVQIMQDAVHRKRID